MKPRIKYYAPFSVNSGYGRAAHDYLLALHREGVELQIVPLYDADLANLPKRYSELIPLLEKQIDPTHVVVHTIPAYAHEFVTTDLEPPKGVKKVAITTWETDQMPLWITERLDQHFDQTIFPSNCIQTGPAPRNVVVPHCYQPAWWYTNPIRLKSRKTFYFYNIGLWIERKNPIGLLKAYLTEFKASDPVELIIVTPNDPREDFENVCKASGLQDLPKVRFITGWTPDEALRQLHEEAHCYVTLTRAEGFGLGAFEAAFMGNDVIATNWGPLTDVVFRAREHYSVHYSRTPVVSELPKLTHPVTVSGLEVPVVLPEEAQLQSELDGHQNWAEPDLANAREQMRRAFERGKIMPSSEARREYEKHYSYPVIAKQFLEALP